MIPKSGNRFSDQIMLNEKNVFADPLTGRMVDFIRGIGIEVRVGALPDGTFLPGLDIQHGAIVVDEAKLAYPGDLLHEAGHIAVSDPATRNGARLAPTDGEEIATLAWSWAALRHLDLEPAVVFHPHGYKNGAQALIDAFSSGGNPGVPLLQYFGMTVEPKFAAARGVTPFPHMLRWMRQQD
jgi:hypothetical protein